MHFRLYEEFNPYTDRELAEKLQMFAKAADSTQVSEITQKGSFFVFDITTKQTSDYIPNGHKIYIVSLPFSQIALASVDTYEKNETDYKKVFHSNIEIRGENDLDVILWNFFETTEIYDDFAVEVLVDNFKHINSEQDIHLLLKTYIPQNKQTKLGSE